MSHLREIDIADYETTVNESAIQILEQVSALAQEGRLRELVMVVELDDGTYMTMSTPAVDCMRRLGMIEMAKHNWISSLGEEE